MITIAKSDIIFPVPGRINEARKNVIKKVKNPDCVESFFIIRACGKLERYFGTRANSQGWSRQTIGQTQFRIDWSV